MAKAAPQAGAAAAPQPPAGAPALTEARVLLQGVHGEVDDVVSLDADTLAQAQQAGAVDPHPDAVAYAKSLKD